MHRVISCIFDCVCVQALKGKWHKLLVDIEYDVIMVYLWCTQNLRQSA